MKKRNLLLIILLFLAAGILVTPSKAYAAANKGPNSSSESFAYITINQYNKDFSRTTKHYTIFGSKNYLKATGEKVKTLKGIKYTKKTNTLTLNSFSHPKYVIEVNEMGSDFKVVVKGKNSIQSLKVWGYGYGGSCAISGKGTLSVNGNKKNQSGHGIVLYAEESSSVLSIAKETTLKAYCNKAYVGNTVYDEEKDELVENPNPGYTGSKGYPVYVVGTKKASKAIVINGKYSGKIKRVKSKYVKCYDYYIKANSLISKPK